MTTRFLFTPNILEAQRFRDADREMGRRCPNCSKEHPTSSARCDDETCIPVLKLQADQDRPSFKSTLSSDFRHGDELGRYEKERDQEYFSPDAFFDKPVDKEKLLAKIKNS